MIKKGYKFIGKIQWKFGEVVWEVLDRKDKDSYYIQIAKNIPTSNYFPPYNLTVSEIKSCKPYLDITKYFK